MRCRVGPSSSGSHATGSPLIRCHCPQGVPPMRRILPLVAILISTLSVQAAPDKSLLLQKPTLSAKEIAFTFAGDLWIVGREGGEARRLTSSVGLDCDAHFAPGGKASPIWIADLGDSRTVKVPREDSNDFCPMWLNGKVFFLSDRTGSVTLFSYDPETKDLKKVLDNPGLDYVSASAGPDGIVLERFGGLELYDVKSGSVRKISISITADFPSIRPHYTKAAKQIHGASISPSGARAVFEARGEILSVPAEKGDIRNMTNTTTACERDPAWSPDGKWVAYFSDESGEYMLHLADPKGTVPVKKIALG